MSGHFTLKNRLDLDKMPIGERIEESDFVAVLPSGAFIQLKYHEENREASPYDVTPGIFSIAKEMQGLVLRTTDFSKEHILESFVHTKTLTDKIDCFFRKFDVYRNKYGKEVPTRGMLLYGPPGAGKSTAIKVISKKYAADSKTVILMWPTDQIDPHDVKEFFKTFRYIQGVEKLILVTEDLGGVEMDQVKMQSYSSLLSLLDNQEMAFKIPTLVLATTNHPEVFLGNISNRPGRFSDKIEMGYLQAEERKGLFKFFLQGADTPSVLEEIGHDRYKEFSPAHLQEVVIRTDLYDLSISDSIASVLEEIETYKKNFSKNKRIGIDQY